MEKRKIVPNVTLREGNTETGYTYHPPGVVCEAEKKFADDAIKRGNALSEADAKAAALAAMAPAEDEAEKKPAAGSK